MVVCVGNHNKQFLDTTAPHRCRDAKFGKMGPDSIRDCSLLADEQVARAVEHHVALLLGCLGWHEPHIGPDDRLPDSLCVGGVILLPLDTGLQVSRRHQPHGVAKCLQLSRPMMRRSAGLDNNKTRGKLLKERQNVATLQLSADDDPASSRHEAER